MATNIDLSTALPEAMATGMSYAEYSAENKAFAKESKTSGPQKEAYVEYTKLGAARLKRWEKVYKPTAETLEGIAALVQPGEQWLVFSETWCGDAAHNLPFIAKKVLEDLAWRMNDDGEADRIGHAKYQEC